ncbi:MAG: phasin family protein [Rhodomicrobium sp.]
MPLHKPMLPQAFPASSGAAGVSAPFSVIPEPPAGETRNPGQASPHSQQQGAAEAGRQEKVAYPFDELYSEANSSAQSICSALTEAFRKSVEQTFHFVEDLSNAKGPLDALNLQFGFAAAQFRLLAEGSASIQGELLKAFLGRMGPAHTYKMRANGQAHNLH